MPKVSVIMGVYNSNIEILKESIISILNQTFSDFEFIICDDSSTNNVVEIIKEFSKKDKRIKLIQNNENKGLAYSLNRCLEIAKGEYIARMDADDKCDKRRFEIQVKMLDKNHDIGVVNLNSYLFDENGIWGEEKHNEMIKNEDFLSNNPIIHPSVMVRKSAYKKVNGYRDIKMTTRVEDYDLFMRMRHENIEMVTIQSFLFYYREDKNSAERRKFKYRINEVKVRYYGFKKLGLLKKKINYIYVIKPIIVSIVPKNIYRKVRRLKKKLKK